MMSKVKWFVVRKPSTGEIIATSANQIVLLKFRGDTKMLYHNGAGRPIQPAPHSVKGDLGLWVRD